MSNQVVNCTIEQRVNKNGRPYFAIFAVDGAHKVMIGFIDKEQEFKLYKYGFLTPVELKK